MKENTFFRTKNSHNRCPNSKCHGWICASPIFFAWYIWVKASVFAYYQWNQFSEIEPNSEVDRHDKQCNNILRWTIKTRLKQNSILSNSRNETHVPRTRTCTCQRQVLQNFLFSITFWFVLDVEVEHTIYKNNS